MVKPINRDKQNNESSGPDRVALTVYVTGELNRLVREAAEEEDRAISAELLVFIKEGLRKRGKLK